MSEQQQIQGIIKCGRGEGGFEYKGHYRADLFFDRHGREFLVDDRPVLKAKAEAEKELAEVESALAAVRASRPSDHAAIGESLEKIERIRARLLALKTGHIDEPGRPLVLTKKLYDYLREANGKSLMFEPWDGMARAAAAVAPAGTPDERLAVVEKGQSELRGMMQQILDQLKRK